MIKIIKEGKVKEPKSVRITRTCPDCECEFEYEDSDAVVDYSMILPSNPPQYNTYIICPCCGKRIHHGYTGSLGEPTYGHVDLTTPDWNFGPRWPNCATCPNRPDPRKITVGDTPCTWCQLNNPYCTTIINTNDTNTTNYTTTETKEK